MSDSSKLVESTPLAERADQTTETPSTAEVPPERNQGATNRSISDVLPPLTECGSRFRRSQRMLGRSILEILGHFDPTVATT